jgi:hypothetical protein
MYASLFNKWLSFFIMIALASSSVGFAEELHVKGDTLSFKDINERYPNQLQFDFGPYYTYKSDNSWESQWDITIHGSAHHIMKGVLKKDAEGNPVKDEQGNAILSFDRLLVFGTVIQYVTNATATTDDSAGSTSDSSSDIASSFNPFEHPGKIYLDTYGAYFPRGNVDTKDFRVGYIIGLGLSTIDLTNSEVTVEPRIWAGARFQSANVAISTGDNGAQKELRGGRHWLILG